MNPIHILDSIKILRTFQQCFIDPKVTFCRLFDATPALCTKLLFILTTTFSSTSTDECYSTISKVLQNTFACLYWIYVVLKIRNSITVHARKLHYYIQLLLLSDVIQTYNRNEIEANIDRNTHIQICTICTLRHLNIFHY